MSCRAARRRGCLAALASLLLIGAGAAACAPGATPSPTYTEVPIGPTVWPEGTTGQYGLHIQPSLLGRLPATVDAYRIAEDTVSETGALDDPDLGKTFDNYAAGAIGAVGAANWLAVVVAHFSPANQTPDAYEQWVADWDATACSQADGVGTTGQEQIGDWLTDTATCIGGPVVYTTILDDYTVVSSLGQGPRDLGRQLIEALH